MAVYLDSIVQEKLDKILQKTVLTGPTGCLEYGVGKTKGNYGRYHMSYPTLEAGTSLKAQMTAHRAVYILSKRRPDMIGEPGTGQVSHLCHNPRCVNIAHLHLESPAANCQRQACQLKKKCQGFCDPACIFPESSALTPPSSSSSSS